MGEKRDTIVLVDFSGLAHACWEPAVSAQEAGEAALASHRTGCAVCTMGDPCSNLPKQYDAKEVFVTNINLKFGTLAEALGSSVKTWVMVKDGRDERRRQLWPAYKANREQRDFDPRPLAESIIRAKGCRFCWNPNAEADDTIATMASDLCDAMNVVIVSSDKDLWQLWDPPRVRIYLTTKKEWLTAEYMEKKLRVNRASQVRLVKALWGDPSDNIPNAIPRMQAQLLPLVKSSDGSLRRFWDEVTNHQGLTAKCHELLAKGQGQVNTNWLVVGLYDDAEVVWL